MVKSLETHDHVVSAFPHDKLVALKFSLYVWHEGSYQALQAKQQASHIIHSTVQ